MDPRVLGERLDADQPVSRGDQPRSGANGAARGHHQRPARGSNFDADASFSNRSRSRLVSFLGTWIITTAYRSPAGAPRLPGIPWPRSLSRRPLDDPGGILTRAVPSSAGTGTSSPSAASHGETGRSTYRSRPSM